MAPRAVVPSIEDHRALAAHRPDFKAPLLGAPRPTIFPSSATATPAAPPSFARGTGYLLDTNVISETRKTRADGGVMAFLLAAGAAGLFLSVLTLVTRYTHDVAATGVLPRRSLAGAVRGAS